MELIVSSMIGAVLAFLGHWAAELASGASGGRRKVVRNRPALSSFPLTSEVTPLAPTRKKRLSTVAGALTVKPVLGAERSGSDRAA